MKSENPIAPGAVLGDMLSRAAHFAAEALSTLPPNLVARLGVVPMFVGVATDPARARLLLQAPDGSVICPYQTDTLPAELGTAAAAVCETGLAQLSDQARRLLAVVTAAGRRVGVLVALDTQAVHVVLEADADVSMILATLTARDAVTH